LAPKVADLFCGIGVGSLGFVKAGFEIAAAVDIDARGCAIYERNLGIAPKVGDLRRISGHEILDGAGLQKGDLDLCTACPPCQPFSSLRKTRLEKGQRDTRKSLLRVFADRVEELFPKIIILENVRGLTVGPNMRFLHEFLHRVQRLGYACDYDVLDSVNFGIPQHRQRLILIGSRISAPALPAASHFSPRESEGASNWRTVRGAIGDLPPLNAGERDAVDPLHQAAAHAPNVLEIIRNIPRNGGGRSSLPKKLWLPCHKKLAKKKQRGAESIYGRMRWDAPSPTITTRSHAPSCGRFVHPDQDRGITLREAARLQTIPDDFEITGTKDEIGMWIGNAFPAIFSEALGRQALRYL
jgi:DNA (cytosine-5)-methyltransferase 1